MYITILYFQENLNNIFFIALASQDTGCAKWSHQGLVIY
uniref:Uncharacterized protein n=1 Tax=Rhizophora mucronata TaxID=61149 RepID=A0A2P2QAD8_RHIMU